MTNDSLVDTRRRVQSVLSVHIHTIHSIRPVSYLVRTESRGSQGGHDDHGDNNLDGGRGSGCHFGDLWLLLFLFLVYEKSYLSKYSVDRSTDSQILRSWETRVNL